jgi:hypothetical protein
MIGQTNNPLLAQTEQQIQAKIKPQLQQAFANALHAAGVVLYSPVMQQRLMHKLQRTPNVLPLIPLGAANIVGILMNQSRGRMPSQIAVPLATSVMCEIFDMFEKAGKVRVTPAVLANATQQLGNAVLNMLGINRDQVHRAVAHGLHAATRGGSAVQQVVQPGIRQSMQRGGRQRMQQGARQSPGRLLQSEPAAAPVAPPSGGIISSAMKRAQ